VGSASKIDFSAGKRQPNKHREKTKEKKEPDARGKTMRPKHRMTKNLRGKANHKRKRRLNRCKKEGHKELKFKNRRRQEHLNSKERAKPTKEENRFHATKKKEREKDARKGTKQSYSQPKEKGGVPEKIARGRKRESV